MSDELDIHSLSEWLIDVGERLDGLKAEVDFVIDNLPALFQESIPDLAEAQAERQAELAAMTAVAYQFLATHLPELKLMNVQELVRVDHWEGRQADLKYHKFWYAAAVCSAPTGPVFASVEREEADGELIRLIPDYWSADCLGDSHER